jgi:hypothetical protein
MSQEKYHGAPSGLPPRTESIVTDRMSGDTNDMISSAASSAKLASIGSLKPLVYLKTAFKLSFFKQNPFPSQSFKPSSLSGIQVQTGKKNTTGFDPAAAYMDFGPVRFGPKANLRHRSNIRNWAHGCQGYTRMPMQNGAEHDSFSFSALLS